MERKGHLRRLVAILAAEEGAPDGQMFVPLDTDVSRRMLDAKSVALQVLRLFATDHDAVLEIGRCRGFEVRERLRAGGMCYLFFCACVHRYLLLVCTSYVFPVVSIWLWASLIERYKLRFSRVER